MRWYKKKIPYWIQRPYAIKTDITEGYSIIICSPERKWRRGIRRHTVKITSTNITF
jgi:hypothetical protein